MNPCNATRVLTVKAEQHALSVSSEGPCGPPTSRFPSAGHFLSPGAPLLSDFVVDVGSLTGKVRHEELTLTNVFQNKICYGSLMLDVVSTDCFDTERCEDRSI